MDFLVADYAGMNAGVIAAWVLIATGAGFAARAIVRGKKFFGFWGDMAIGLVGVYLMAVILKLLGVNLTERLHTWVPSLGDIAVWINVALSALIGALVIRGVLRPFTGGG
jgi:uncharacterized membrane protein YeaQ/YmgE (transglycosylase-associated protein family)